MNRIIAVILAAALLFALTSCGKENKGGDPSGAEKETVADGEMNTDMRKDESESITSHSYTYDVPDAVPPAEELVGTWMATDSLKSSYTSVFVINKDGSGTADTSRVSDNILVSGDKLYWGDATYTLKSKGLYVSFCTETENDLILAVSADADRDPELIGEWKGDNGNAGTVSFTFRADGTAAFKAENTGNTAEYLCVWGDDGNGHLTLINEIGHVMFDASEYSLNGDRMTARLSEDHTMEFEKIN